MADSAIGKLIPLNFQFPESVVEMTDDGLRLLGCACELDVVHVFGKHGNQLQIEPYHFVLQAHLGINQTGFHLDLLVGN